MPSLKPFTEKPLDCGQHGCVDVQMTFSLEGSCYPLLYLQMEKKTAYGLFLARQVVFSHLPRQAAELPRGAICAPSTKGSLHEVML